VDFVQMAQLPPFTPLRGPEPFEASALLRVQSP
jgi:hypothetical protein